MSRAGGQGSVESWLNALDNGLSKAEALLGFSDSLENQHQLAPLLNTINYQADNGLWVFS
ncbi:MAG TPA: DUF4214 domain-containing protein [Gammaproteobacteria bacterium]|nr:DUF4214 domain-containing protein [Gammaproteobacteria bacterium]